MGSPFRPQQLGPDKRRKYRRLHHRAGHDSRCGDKFHINLNGGWLYDNVAKISYLAWGAGFEWGFVDKFTLIGEVFGQAGALPAANPGDPPPPNSIREPQTQFGVRFTPQDNIDIDLIWGHNITGENAQWSTLGVNLRF